MPRQIRAEDLERKIHELKCAIVQQQSAIAHLEAKGVEIYNNRTPCVFEDTEATRQRRQNEAHPPEIYERSGEEILDNLRGKLQETESKLAELEFEFAKLQRKN